MSIRDYRKSKLLSVSEFAEKVGVTATTVNKWENGSNIRMSNLRKIAKAFDLTNTEVLFICNKSTENSI